MSAEPSPEIVVELARRMRAVDQAELDAAGHISDQSLFPLPITAARLALIVMMNDMVTQTRNSMEHTANSVRMMTETTLSFRDGKRAPHPNDELLLEMYRSDGNGPI